MMRSLFAGVSALRNHQARMDVIANNIANVNTIGYKKARVRFQDVLSQTLRDPSRPQNNRGGTNPVQIGLGMRIGSVDVIHTPGSMEPTGTNTDMAIQGDGFFVVNDGNRNYYTRAGLFALDAGDNLVMKTNGMKVMGYQWNGTDFDTTLSELKIELGALASPKKTESVTVSGNLNPNNADPIPLTVEVFDSLGNKHSVNLEFTRTGPNQWDWQADGPDVNGNLPVTGSVNFDPDGTNPTPTTISLPGVQFDTAAETQDITIDVSAFTQYVDESELVVKSQDGYEAATLATYGVDTSGIITAQYSNGRTETVGRIATALFSNPAGLIKAGESLYTDSSNSGLPEIGPADSGGRGKIASQNLEMSNVDLSEEFSNMIITQRGFQANSRIITTSDEMLQELVNLKR